MRKDKLVIVMGFLGGTKRSHYKPMIDDVLRSTKAIGSKYYDFDFETIYYLPDSDWNPDRIADAIVDMNGDHKVVICLSCGAIVGNKVAAKRHTNVDVYYICPVLGREFLAFRQKWLLGLLRPIIGLLMLVSMPFMKHQWWPIFGGTKPDGNFLSIYAILKQLWYVFRQSGRIIKDVDGVIYSAGDRTVDNDMVVKTFKNHVEAIGTYRPPLHANFRPNNIKRFERNAQYGVENGRSNDAEAYTDALSELIYS